MKSTLRLYLATAMLLLANHPGLSYHFPGHTPKRARSEETKYLLVEIDSNDHGSPQKGKLCNHDLQF